MSKKILLLYLFILTIISSVPLISEAQVTGGAVSAKVDYPYFRNIQKKTVVVHDSLSSGWADMETRDEDKVGRSAFFNFILDSTVPNLPPFTYIFAKEKSSSKDSSLNSPGYINRYHTIGCTTDHKFKLYSSPKNSTNEEKVDAKLRTVCKAPRGYSGTDSGYREVVDPPFIDIKQTRGDFKVEEINDINTVTYAVKQESKAVLTLVTPPENLCIKYSRYLLNRCAKSAVSNLLPGGFVISETGVVTQITAELENLIFRNNPVWSVPIKVTAKILTPRLNDESTLVFDETIVPCSGIKVLNKKLNADCTTKINIREKQILKDITPTVSGAKYYSFDVEITGAPVINKSTIFANVIDSLVAAVYPVEEGRVTLDEEGFMVVADDNVEYLALSSSGDEDEVDTAAPSTPGKPSVSNLRYNSLRLSWTSSVDNVGISEYRVFRNGTLMGPSRSNTYSVTNLTENTTYDFQVSAVDKAGNVSDLSQSLQVVTPTRSVVVTPPAAPRITSVLPLSAKPGDTVTLSGTNFTGVIGDLISISNSSGSVSPETIYSTSASAVVFKMPNLPVGTYYIDLVANSGTSNRVTINVLQSSAQLPTPFISSISPTSGKFGDIITLRGVNFEGVTSDLLFIQDTRGVISPDIVSSSATSVTFKVPNIPTGGYKVWMFTDKGESNQVTFTVLSSVSTKKSILQMANVIMSIFVR